ncbi:hypothetical protein [Flammeovirga agarivorans]|uniref:Lipoprotein n=1 Tax=Flammeovirga agarivorans TaxID=2726742 RepID=A0A7X8XXV6_9BACT|nr:hypothetical protein [Flammeovirga agarivorans]NLR93616.1 hypothetical protein [Flammeovirga agarivorans]
MKKYLLFIGLLFIVFSCSKKSYYQSPKQSTKDNCFSVYSNDELKISIDYDVLEDTFMTNRFSKSSLILAEIYGVSEDIKAYKRLDEKIKAGNMNDRILLHKSYYQNEIDKRLQLASFENDGLLSSIHCEQLRLARILNDLTALNNKKQTRLSNAAIIVGTLSTVLVAGILISKDEGLNDSDAKDWIGIAGAVAGTYLAVKSSRQDATVEVDHHKNIIRSVYAKTNQQKLFSSTIWYMLTDENIVDGNGRTGIEIIKDNWKPFEEQFTEEEKMERLRVLLLPSGIYNQELLRLRIDMLGEIENGVEAMNKALSKLNREL